MTIDSKTMDKLEKLSSLDITDEAKDSIAKELADIVGFIENLNEIDVSHVNATFTTIEGGQPLREDVNFTEDGLSDRIMTNAPRTEDNYFIVPAIIE